jgi:predicted secreted protein
MTAMSMFHCRSNHFPRALSSGTADLEEHYRKKGSIIMKLIILLTALMVLISSPPLMAMAPSPTMPAVAPGACWNPDAATMDKIRRDCAPRSGEFFEACFLAGMQKAGASREAVTFARSIGNLGYLQELRRQGPVDIAFVIYPFRANENQGFLLVNGDPPQIDVDDLNLLSPDKLKKDSRYNRLRQRYPAVELWPGDRSSREFPSAQTTMDGGQRFVVRYRLLNGCHACELTGYARYAFDFDKTGRFQQTSYLGIEESFRGSPAQAYHDPESPLQVRTGETFTLTLRSNPTTGYSWELDGPLNEKLVRFVGREYLADQTGLVGSGGREIWTYEMAGMGETFIQLKYVRPWEKGIAPAKTARFHIIGVGDNWNKSKNP